MTPFRRKEGTLQAQLDGKQCVKVNRKGIKVDCYVFTGFVLKRQKEQFAFTTLSFVNISQTNANLFNIY